MPNFDEVVGSNVAAYRQSQGMSQADLARAMSEEGHAFHQQTVQKLEKGSRPVRLEEALSLARVLDVDVEVLWDEDLVIDANRSLIEARTSWQQAAHRLELAAEAFVDQRANLRAVIQTFAARGANEQLLDNARHDAKFEPRDIADNAGLRRDAIRAAEATMTNELLAAAQQTPKEVSDLVQHHEEA